MNISKEGRKIIENLKMDIDSDPFLRREYEIEKERYEISMKLKEIREKRGLTQQDVSSKSGLTEKKIEDIETYNNNPSIGSIIRYCDAIDVKLSDLLTKYCEEGDTNGNI